MKSNFISKISLTTAMLLAFTACGAEQNAEDTATSDTSVEQPVDQEVEEAKDDLADEESETVEEELETDKAASEVYDFEGRTLNVVATSDSYVPLFEEFTNETGADVEFLSMSSGEVISRTKAEVRLWQTFGLVVA